MTCLTPTFERTFCRNRAASGLPLISPGSIVHGPLFRKTASRGRSQSAHECVRASSLTAGDVCMQVPCMHGATGEQGDVWRWIQLSLINMRCTGILIEEESRPDSHHSFPDLYTIADRCMHHLLIPPHNACRNFCIRTPTPASTLLTLLKAIAYRRPRSASKSGVLARSRYL